VRDRNFPTRHHAHVRTSLAARGRFWRVFGAQAIFLALAFSMLGAYILEQQFAYPMQAYSEGLLFAAVLIAAAISLLYCLLRPARRVRRRIIVRPIPVSHRNDQGLAATERRLLAWREMSEEALQCNRYVDRTRIRA
jgi:hypothetical protein